MVYGWIFLAFLFFCLGSFLSYSKPLHDRWWFPVSFGVMSMITGYLWSIVCRMTSERDKILIYSIYWDVLLAFAYYGFPIVFGSLVLTNTSYAGIIMVVIGIILIHF